MNILVIFALKIILCVTIIQGQSYEDARCKCICTVINGTQIYKELHIRNVPPNNDCDSVVIPPTEGKAQNKTVETCPRCQCKYEARNTTTIKVVVIIVVWVISLLLVYMMFLICLDPLLNNRLRRSNYVEHTNEEDEVPDQRTETFGGPQQMTISGGAGVSAEGGSNTNVLHRVSAQQDKWKKQVREQRNHIYNQHTMLN
ncbi:uncharacterized protein CG1161 isoform X2 [Planococcus citri]|uniref:uncharacterized protein CG1161 isoform X2 n=1 Tax=Planococcus citri TaxID=170843 RepID=UPI0031F7374A